MKNKISLLISSTSMAVFITVVLMSCDKKFDEPPVSPIIPTDTSISNHIITLRALKSRHTIAGLEQIQDNVVVAVTVSADDESGNFYKQLAVQDSTGGILLKLDRSSLYTDYPVGRKLFIKCKNLYISDYYHAIELGVLDNIVPSNPALGSIPSVYFDTYLVKGTLDNTITPKIATLAQLNTMASISSTNIPSKDTLQSVLLQLNNIELATTDMGYIYADTSAAKKAVSRNLTDCNGIVGVVMYTSGFANFAGFHIPTGKGVVKGIFTPYKTTAELLVRDTTDVQLYGTRCGAIAATTFFNETFSGITNAVIITTTGSSNVWKNIAEVGGAFYTGYVSTSGTSHMASISGFVAGGVTHAVINSWMITQAITIPATTNTLSLSFVSADGYYAGALFQVLVSTDYNNSNMPSNSTWTVLPATISNGHTKYTTPVPSGGIDLSNYIGKTIYLAWRYSSTTTAQSGTGYEFGTVKLVGY